MDNIIALMMLMACIYALFKINRKKDDGGSPKHLMHRKGDPMPKGYTVYHDFSKPIDLDDTMEHIKDGGM